MSVSERRREDGAPGGIVGEIEYAADLFERGTVEGLAGRLVRLLAGAVAHPDCPIVRLELLGAEERESILAGWNATGREVLPGSLPFLFAAQAGKRPDATAVVFERGRLSYGELDRRSNQLAHHLRGLGVGPETVVGLCLERSLELIVGLLGILKAGGAYLPLDPQYPAQRLAFMLGDAGARVLVTQAGVAGSPGSCQRQRLRRGGAAGCGCGGHCRAAHARSAARARPPPPRLCHLHLGLNRNAEGSGGRSRGAEKFAALDSGASCKLTGTIPWQRLRASALISLRSSSFFRCSVGRVSRSVEANSSVILQDSHESS